MLFRSRELASRWKRFVGPGQPSGRSGDRAPWGVLLDLIYGGHAAEAWPLLQAAWPGDAASMREFRGKLLGRLRQSPAWPALRELNGASLDG